MDPRDVGTMALIAGPAVALGSALLVVGIWRLVARRRGVLGEIIRWYRSLPHRRR